MTSVVESLIEPNLISFRVNTLKVPIEEVLTQLSLMGIMPKCIPWFQSAFTIPSLQRKLLMGCELYSAGKIYLQNASSLLPVLILDPKPNDYILDLAAAPGSKTSQMACLMQNTGQIAAVEKSKSRFFKLIQNLKQQGVTCVRTFLKDGTIIGRLCPERFDKVLLDAPCSSEGRFEANNPKTYLYWSEKKINEMARKQRKLIISAFQALKPGGILVYSTCTFAPEENEAVIIFLMDKFQDRLTIEKIDLPFSNIQSGLSHWENQVYPSVLQNCIRVLPNEYMGGFFICKIRKK